MKGTSICGLACVAALSLWVASPGTAAVSTSPRAATTTRRAARHRATSPRLPLLLVENRGQTDADVVAYARGRGETVYFTPDGVTYALTRGGKRWAVKSDFVDARADVRPELRDEAPTRVSYFKGTNDRQHAGLRTFREIAYRDVWPGIDLVYTAGTDELKYAFLVRPGADPSRIRIAWRGADVVVDAAGALAVTTPVAGFTDAKPVVWQDVDGRRVAVDAAYALDAGVCGFRLGAYDARLPLVVDPQTVVYAGFVGGDGEDVGAGIAADDAGNAYVTGTTSSSDTTFPHKVGPDASQNGDKDAFIAKVAPDGKSLVYVGYIGGAARDRGLGVAVDKFGAAYVVGDTISPAATFPEKTGPDVAFNGGLDAFVAKVAPTGVSLDWCGYVGGASDDIGSAIAVDKDGNAYITGSTASSAATFPVAVGPTTTYSAVILQYAFVARVKADGTGLDYCGYIGGGVGTGIAVDKDGAAYVTGLTSLSSFPVMTGPTTSLNGGQPTGDLDAFVTKVKPDGSGFVYSGFVGGSDSDVGAAIAVDDQGRAYVTGQTLSSAAEHFPATFGPNQTLDAVSGIDAFVARVKDDGSGFDYCGYVGGDGEEYGRGIAVNAAYEAYVTGSVTHDETTFPILGGPDLTPGGNGDAFVTRITADGVALLSSGFLGGDNGDEGDAIALDVSGNVYVTGFTSSSAASIPAVAGPSLTRGAGGGNDVLVVKIGAPITLPTTVIDSFLLPTKATAAFNAKKPLKSKLTVAGVFDFGSYIPCIRVASTLDVGGLHFDIPGLVASKNGKTFTYAAGGLKFTITPNARGTSKAAFTLTYVGDLTGKIPTDGPLAIHFVDDVGHADATVTLTGGGFKLAAPHGGMLEPCLFVGKATARLLGPGKDTLSMTVGVATDGTVPGFIPCIKVGFGDTFSQDILTASFHRVGKSARYVAKGNFGGLTSVTVDYAAQTVAITGKNMTLGTFAQGANTVVVSVDVGDGPRAVKVVMARNGAAMTY